MASITLTANEDSCSSSLPAKAARPFRVAVIGAGIAGLTSAIHLASRGCEVSLFERNAVPGGKIRQVIVAGKAIDAGPTVLTMRWVFERLFSEIGSSLDDWVKTRPLDILCRHAWQDGSRLDLFADKKRSIEAIAGFAGKQEAEGYRRFAEDSERLYRALEPTFIDADRPSAVGLFARMAVKDPGSVFVTNPSASLWRTLCRYFSDARLRQLFARYATYSGASPFEAPSTLMLIAHVEQEGVWSVDGGMAALAQALERLAQSLGVTFAYDCHVDRLELKADRIAGLRFNRTEYSPADAVILNADCEALAQGLFGTPTSHAVRKNNSGRSLSALATALVGIPEGWPLTRHNVCFSDDYRAEFDDIFKRGRLPGQPTVYICAQDRNADGLANSSLEAGGTERALILVNAPPNGDRHNYEPTEIEQCWATTLAVLRNCGLQFATPGPFRHTTTPTGFEHLFPATAGALYGRSSHGWDAAFRRPGNRTAIPGLYLAGGSVHPGAGVPMAALSGRLAAANLLADRASTRKYHRVAISGGTSTH